jgi:hypothetical protein
VLAQVSFEFISFLVVVFILLFLTVYYHSNLYNQIYSTRVFREAQAVSDQIASEVNLALKVGDGYSRSFFLPAKILNTIDYNITLKNYYVIVAWNGNSVEATILTKNVTGEFLKGKNMIRNSGGVIYVNQ